MSALELEEARVLAAHAGFTSMNKSHQDDLKSALESAEENLRRSLNWNQNEPTP